MAVVSATLLWLVAGCAALTGQQAFTPTPNPPVAISEIKLIEPTQAGGSYRLEATIRHETAGGTAMVTFRVRDRASGQAFESTGPVELRPGVVLIAVAEVTAPPGNYAPEAVVRFPAR